MMLQILKLISSSRYSSSFHILAFSPLYRARYLRGRRESGIAPSVFISCNNNPTPFPPFLPFSPSLSSEGQHWVSVTSCLCSIHPTPTAAKQTAKAAAQHKREVILTQCYPSVCKLASLLFICSSYFPQGTRRRQLMVDVTYLFLASISLLSSPRSIPAPCQ